MRRSSTIAQHVWMMIVILDIRIMVAGKQDDDHNPPVTTSQKGEASMGHSRAAKSRSRDRILDIGAARFRERGFDGIGVADLMKEAQLTHGGFYRHFNSREDLVAESLEHALAQGGERMRELAASTEPAPLLALVDRYLSVAHRDNVDDSCAVCALANDVARSSDRLRDAYAAQVEYYVTLIGRLMPGKGSAKARRRRAIGAFSTMVGALAMARAVRDPEFSLEILNAAAEVLKGRKAHHEERPDQQPMAAGGRFEQKRE